MKKFYSVLVLIITLLSIQSNAQLNYIFSASSRPYISVKNGITPPLKTDYTNWEASDEGFARVPIGFTFKYNGISYDSANIDANGFITLKDSLDVFYNYAYFRNSIASAPPYYKRPIIAAFWDDLYLVDSTNLVYKTTGFAPFRVFTVEWKKAHWSYSAPDPVLSIELKLYETTNIIEFHYKDEGGVPYAQYAFASIGITSADANRDFISLQSTSANPKISMLKAMDSLTNKPANNQVYRFIPAIPDIPTTIRSSLTYTDKEATVTLDSKDRFSTYEYAVTESPVPPVSGIISFSPDIHVSSFKSATTYYIYARSNWLNFLYSQWACDSFVTAVKPQELPYRFGSLSTPSGLPDNIRQQNFTDTNFYYNPQYYFGWTAGSDYPNIGDTSFYDYNIDFYDANDWLFTPGLKLNAGKIYQLKFGYLSFYEYNDGDPSKLEVKYGTANNVAAMTSGTLFKNTNIINGDNLIDTIIEFMPVKSGVYYFGFHNFTPILEGTPVVANLSINEKTTTSNQIPIALKGITHNEENTLDWGKNNARNIELQRSTDGINFAKIATVNNQHNNTIRQYNFKPKSNLYNIEFWNNLKGKSKFEYERALSSLTSAEQLRIKSNSDVNTAEMNTANKYVDKNTQGMNYYRLQYTDKNGAVSYSNIVKLEQVRAINTYPNPAKDLLNVKIGSSKGNTAALLITDVTGKAMLSQSASLNKGETTIGVDISNYAPGIYFIKILNADGSEKGRAKFIKGL